MLRLFEGRSAAAVGASRRSCRLWWRRSGPGRACRRRRGGTTFIIRTSFSVGGVLPTLGACARHLPRRWRVSCRWTWLKTVPVLVPPPQRQPIASPAWLGSRLATAVLSGPTTESIRFAWRVWFRRWTDDDHGSHRPACVPGAWPRRHAQGDAGAGGSGPGGSRKRPVLRPPVRIPWSSGRLGEGFVLGQPGVLPVRQAPGKGPLRLAVHASRRGASGRRPIGHVAPAIMPLPELVRQNAHLA